VNARHRAPLHLSLDSEVREHAAGELGDHLVERCDAARRRRALERSRDPPGRAPAQAAQLSAEHELLPAFVQLRAESRTLHEPAEHDHPHPDRDRDRPHLELRLRRDGALEDLARIVDLDGRLDRRPFTDRRRQRVPLVDDAEQVVDSCELDRQQGSGADGGLLARSVVGEVLDHHRAAGLPRPHDEQQEPEGARDQPEVRNRAELRGDGRGCGAADRVDEPASLTRGRVDEASGLVHDEEPKTPPLDQERAAHRPRPWA
jgi:hypothetical protein